MSHSSRNEGVSTQVNIFFLFLHKTYVVGTHCRGASNEYPQHMFSCKNKKNRNMFGLKKASYQELCFSYFTM